MDIADCDQTWLRWLQCAAEMHGWFFLIRKPLGLLMVGVVIWVVTTAIICAVIDRCKLARFFPQSWHYQTTSGQIGNPLHSRISVYIAFALTMVVVAYIARRAWLNLLDTALGGWDDL